VTAPEEPPEEYVDAWELRRLFNDNVAPLLDSGGAELELIRAKPPAAAMNQPPGTVSQMLRVHKVDDRGRRCGQLAVCHRYVSSKKTTLLDPKWVRWDGCTYYVDD
jgi:hypothetical protein